MSKKSKHATEASAEADGRLARRTWKSGFFRFLRATEAVLAIAMVVYLLLVFLPFVDWIHAAMDCQDELQPADYIVCLGGAPARVIEAARLWEEGYADYLVVSNNSGAVHKMRKLAEDWGVPRSQIIVDGQSWTTRDHPGGVARAAGLDPAVDACIIVTSYDHMARSKASFKKAGYRHLILREPRWERSFRQPLTWVGRFQLLPELCYEGAAWVEYWVRGAV